MPHNDQACGALLDKYALQSRPFTFQWLILLMKRTSFYDSWKLSLVSHCCFLSTWSCLSDLFGTKELYALLVLMMSMFYIYQIHWNTLLVSAIFPIVECKAFYYFYHGVDIETRKLSDPPPPMYETLISRIIFHLVVFSFYSPKRLISNVDRFGKVKLSLS